MPGQTLRQPWGEPEAPAAGLPSPYHYGQVLTGQATVQTFTLANSGGSASRALKVRLAGSAQFTRTADTCTGISLQPGKSCTVTVQFAAAGAGKATARLTVAHDKTVLATGTLTGTGVVPGHLYWTTSDTVVAANLDGTGATTLASGQNTPSGLTLGP